MEAASTRRHVLHATSGGEPLLPVDDAAHSRLLHGFADPVRDMLVEIGRMASFMRAAIAAVPPSWTYAAEIMRQAGILLVGSSLVLLGLQFVIGLECGTEGNYLLRGFGASSYTGAFTALCSVREAGPFMFGFIAAAKIGSGFAAELGTMRISDELAALEAQGISAIRYVVATRLIAVWLVTPFWFFAGMVCGFLGDYVVIVLQIGEVSRGGWLQVHWAFISPYDLAVSLLKFYSMGTLVALIAMYFGYHAKKGPVGVGSATARAMSFNLIQVMAVNALITMLAWGFGSPKVPIGG